jgi:hypothetical protein
LTIQLLGQNGVGWNPTPANDFNATGYMLRITGGYIPITGIIRAAHVVVLPGGSATRATLYLYAGPNGGTGDSFVAMSPEFDVSTPGEKIVPFVGTARVDAGKYSICIQPASGGITLTTNSGSSNAVGRQNTPATFPYRVPPPIMPNNDFSNGHEFLTWFDGTVGLVPQGVVHDNDPSALVSPILVQLSNASTSMARVSNLQNNQSVLTELSQATLLAGTRMPLFAGSVSPSFSP